MCAVEAQRCVDCVSAVLYGDTTLTFLSNLQRADDAGTSMGYVSAVAVEEKSVLDYTRAIRREIRSRMGSTRPRRCHSSPSIPKEGTLLSDNPFILLNADWVKDPVKTGAADFLAWLRAPSQQKVFTDAGFRSYEGKPGAAIAASSAVLANGAAVILTPPSSSVLAGIRAAWAELRHAPVRGDPQSGGQAQGGLGSIENHRSCAADRRPE